MPAHVAARATMPDSDLLKFEPWTLMTAFSVVVRYASRHPPK
jgi:hypothetical protein